jgi:tetratricopeptide (TPR) repeat protein
LLSRLYYGAGDEHKAAAQEAAFEQELAAWPKKDRVPAEAASDPCSPHEYSVCASHLQSQKTRNASSSLILGKALLALADYSRAADAFADVLSHDGANLAARYWLARSYKRLADQAYAHLLQEFPESGRTHQFRAESDQLRETYDDAIKEYQAAIRLRPNEPELHEKLSQIYLEKKSFAEAERELRKAIELDPQRPRTLYLLGRSRFSQHQERESVPYLQQAVRLDPGLLEARAALGQAYMRLRQPERALPELEKAAPIDFHGDLHYLLYVAYRSLGRKDLAQQALARSQELRENLAAKGQAKMAGIIDEGVQQ